MAITVKHSKVSTIPDDADTSLVRPSDWNDDHVLTGTIPVANGGTGASTLTGYVKGNGTANMTASATVPSTDVTGLGTMSTQNSNNISVTGGSMSGVTISDYVATATKGVANGVASLDGSGTVPIAQLPAAVLGALSYQGTWNASTNTPTLTSSVGTKGYYYVVSVAGSTNLNGITDWVVGDWAVYNGSAWQKVDNTDAVTSVNGYTGTVVLTQTDISGTVPTSRTITAGTGLTGGGDLSANRTLAIDSSVVTLTGTQTLTNKTLTAPKIDLINDTNGNEILGLSPTTSATDYLVVKNGIGVGVPLHLYADGSSTNTGIHIQPKGTGLVTISDGTDFNKGIRFRSSSSAASAITLLDAVSTAGRVVTLPDATTTLVGRDTTDTLTNKSISGSTNTLSNIGNSSLTNSAITINGTSTSLGGSISVGTVTSVTGTSPVVSSGGATPAISMPAATTSVNGYLTSTDWNTFNNKGSGTVTSVSATSPVTSTGGATPTIAIPAATTSVSGYLTSTDWTTFNNKGSGTVTSVAALTLGTTGTDLSSTVATGTTTPVITLQVPTASATNRGALSAADWTTFNNKGSGTVTAVSVASANGFAGTSSGGATPALTLTTSITGVLKGNGAAISAATSGTDYSAGTSALSTGILKSTTTTGALTIAVAADFPTLNQNTTGTASNVTGTVAIANGGTGQTTRQDAMDALAGATTSGSYLRGNGTDVVMSTIQAADVPTLNQDTTGTAAKANALNSATTVVNVSSSSAPSAGQVLTATSGTAATWQTPASGGVTTFSAGTTGFTPSSATSGAVTLAGTLALANGGTGQTTANAAYNALSPMTTTGDIEYRNGSSVATRLGIGTTGQVLTVASGIPSWATPSGSNITTLGLYENSATISANYTIGTGNNAMSAGPITVDTGFTVTVPTGSTWTVV
jgi:hypothetical protein